MKKALVILLALAGIGLVACKPKVDPNEPGSKLLEERCYRCHPTGINTMGRSAADWDAVVVRMVNKGAVITTQEKTVLVDYLAKSFKK